MKCVPTLQDPQSGAFRIRKTKAAARMVPEWVAARDRVLAEMNQGTMPILRNFGIVLLVGYSAEILLRFLLRQSASRSAARAGHGLNSRALP